MTLLARLPPLLPDLTPPEALPPSLVVGGLIYLPSEGAHPVSVTRTGLDVALNTTPRQTARGRTWASGSRTQKPVTLPLTFRVEGTGALDVATRAERWHALALSATEYGEGASSLTILAVLDHQEPFGEGNTRTFRVTYLVRDARWRLDDGDPNPTSLPVQGVLGNYPLGMLYADTEGPNYYDVVPLGGVEIASAPAATFTHPDATFTYPNLIEVTDDESS